MSKRWQALLVVAAVCLPLAAASDAHALFAISPGGEITMPSTGRFTITGSSGARISCEVTLTGSLSPGPIAETRGTRFGTIRRSTYSGCPAGTSIEMLGEANIEFNVWLVTREGRLIGKLYWVSPYSFLITQPDGLAGQTKCLYSGRFELLATVEPAGTDGPSTFLGGSATIPLASSLLNPSLIRTCESSVTFAGTAPFSPAQTLRH